MFDSLSNKMSFAFDIKDFVQDGSLKQFHVSLVADFRIITFCSIFPTFDNIPLWKN